MNLGQIRSEIRRFIKDTSSSSSMQRWTDAILLTRINAVQEEMVAFTTMLEGQSDVDVVLGTPEYAFPSTILAVKKAYILDSNGVYSNLQKTTTTQLDLSDPMWQDVDGTPTKYYIRDNYIGLYPNPDFSRTSGLRLEVIERPTDLSSDADVPFNSEYQFYFAHEGICFGVARLCLMDDGKWTDVQAYESKYFTVIKEIQKQISSENLDVRLPNVYEQGRSVRRTR